MTERFDLVVIGGGPGGYVAAIRSAQLGLRTALVERKHLGGICLNWGCIPTKAMLHGAQVAHALKTAGHFGFELGPVHFDIAKQVGHSRAVANGLAGGVEFLLEKNGVCVFDGEAKLARDGLVNVALNSGENLMLEAEHIILATGARPRTLPGLQPDGERIWTYFEAMVPEALPESLLVIGSGAIGSEFASLYSDLGSKVTLVEVADRVLPAEDVDVSAFVEKSFRKRVIDVRTRVKVQSASVGSDGIVCDLISEVDRVETLIVDRVILAVGVTANIESLGLEELGVAVDSGFIRTDEWGRTSVDGIYAIGDVAGAPCLAHKASHQGVACVERLAGVPGAHSVVHENVPACTYCRPQVASLGMTEAHARQRGFDVHVGRFSLKHNGKALATGEAEGFVKVIFDHRSGELLGAHMVGPEVTEMLQGFGVAQSLEVTAEEFSRTMFSHPTVSEAMHEAVLDSLGRALHQ